MIVAENQSPEHPRETAITVWGHHDCRYATNQSGPDQWVAVGIVPAAEMELNPGYRLLVGIGRTEATAVRSLRRRCRWAQAV